MSMSDETQYACPFCGEMSSSRNRGKHFEWHRRKGDAPLAMNGSLDAGEDGLWDITVTIADTGAPVLVPKEYQASPTRVDAQKSLRAFMQSTANGKRKKKVTAVKEVGDPTPRTTTTTPVSDSDIVAALVKLAGVTSIPVKQFTQVSQWVEATRALMKEVAR